MTQDVRLRLSVSGQAQVVDALGAASAALDAVTGGSKRVVDAIRPAGAALDVVGADARTATNALDVLSGKLGSTAKTAPGLQQALGGLGAAEAALATGTGRVADALDALGLAAGAGGRRVSEAGAAATSTSRVFDQLSAAQGRQARSGTEVATSAAAASRALGMLTPQLGDLVAQISAGGSPVTALIQQGLQMRDMFAADEAALQGLKSLISPTVVGLGLLTGATAAVAAAYAQGSGEADAYEQAIIMTGNAAGTTTGALAAMARQSAATTGTVHANAEALAALVSTGRVGAGQLQQAGEVAVAMERELGISVTDTAKRFAELGKDPLAASLKLNESLHYLTDGTREHIRSLQEQGRVAEAIAAAQQTYSEAMSERMDKLQDGLGGIERAWRAVKAEAARAWDSMLDIGREDALDEKLKKAQEKVDMLQRQQRANLALIGLGVSVPMGDNLDLGAAQKELDILRQQKAEQDGMAASAAAATAAADAKSKWDGQSTQYMSRQDQMVRAIVQQYNLGVAAKLSEEEIAKRIALIQQQYDPGTNLVAVQASEQQRLEVIKRGQDQVNLLRATGVLNERQAIEQTTQLDLQAIGVHRDALQGQLDIIGKRQGAERQAAELSAQIAQANAQYVTRRLEGENAIEKLKRSQLTAANAVLEAQRREEEEVRNRLKVEEGIARQRLYAGFDEQARAQREQLEVDRLELSLLGQTSEARATAIAQLRIEQQLREKIREIKATTPPDGVDGEAWRQEQINRATQLASEAAAQAQTRIYLDQWQRTTDQIGQSLSDALMQGGKSAWEYIKGLFRSMVLRPVIQGVVQPVVGSVASAFAPNGTAGGAGAMGYVNTASSAYNLYGAAGSLYTVGAQYAAGTMSAANAAGTIYGNAAAAAYGDGLSALLATNGAYGTAAGAGAAGGAAAAEGAAAAGGAAAGGSSMMSSVAAAGPYAIAALVIANALGLFRTTKQVGGGVMGTVGDTTDIQSYDLMRKSGTLFAGPDYSYRTRAADPALVGAIAAGVGSVLDSTRAQAAALGIGGNIAGFTGTLGTDAIHPDTGGVGIKLDGLTPEQAQQKIAQAVSTLANDAATQALGRIGKYFARTGETATQTLTRLSSSLSTVNDTFETLGETLLPAALRGGDLASSLLDVAGGTDAFISATNGYFESMYSDSQKLAAAQNRLSGAFDGLSLAMPANEAAYRGLVAAQDISTDAGRRARVELMQLAPAFAQVAEQAKQVAEQAREQAQALAAGLASRSARGSQLAQLRADAQDAAAALHDTIETMLGAARDAAGGNNLMSSGGTVTTIQAWTAAQNMVRAQAGGVLLDRPLDGMELEMERVRANAAAMRDELVRFYGARAEEISNLAVVRQQSLLRRDWLADVGSQLLQLTDASAYAAAQLKEEQQQRLADAKALGLSAVEMKKIVELNDAQTAALKAQQASWKDSAGTSLRAWLNTQLLGNTSTLDPGGRLTEAQTQFAGLLGRARDRDQGALSGITGAADALISAGQAMYGSGTQQAALVKMTRQALQSLGQSLQLPGFSPADQLAEARRQTTELQRMVREQQALVRQNGAGMSSMLGELQRMNARLQELETLQRRQAA